MILLSMYTYFKHLLLATRRHRILGWVIFVLTQCNCSILLYRSNIVVETHFSGFWFHSTNGKLYIVWKV